MNFIKIKQYFRLLIPPIFYILFKKIKGKKETPKSLGWFGNYKTWEDAKAKSTGYEHSAIVDQVLQATKKVINKEALFERDSVTFNRMEYNWPVLSLLSKIGIENTGNLNVLDFGGALGSSFFQNKFFLGEQYTYNWKIVEQAHYVKVAKENIKHTGVSFYENIKDAAKDGEIDIILLSSVLPYIENFKEIITTLIELQAKHIIIDRTTFINCEERITLQIVPESIYRASYPCRFFNTDELTGFFNDSYHKVLEFPSYCDPSTYVFEDGKIGTWKGLYLQLI